MRQEINLYQPILRRTRPLFCARSLAWTLAITLVTLGALYAYARHEVDTLAAAVQGLERQRDAAREQLLALEKTLPKREPSRLLASEVQRLHDNVASRAALVSMLASPDDASGDGFSAHLEALARQRVDGLWLTGLRLRRAGRDLVIRGSALDAALVPVLVQRLGGEPAFAGKRFAALTIDRSSDAPERVDFELRTRVDADGTTDHAR